MNPARRICVTAVAVLAALAGSPGLAQAQQPSQTRLLSTTDDNRLPRGWRIDGEHGSRELVWRASKSVPTGDARVEFRAGDRLLGVPKPAKDGRTFRLALDEVGSTALTDLQVTAAGRRLDAAADQPRESDAPGVRLPAQAPANGVDPGKPGSYRTVSGSYDLAPVRLPGFATPVEMRAQVVAPKGAAGSRPLALFLHGRHSTCYKPGSEDDTTIDWPCADGYKPIPSDKGYLRDQKLLASQGYVTVSISANGINAQDWQAEDAGAQARSSLVRQHLAHWADWAAHRSTAPAVVRQAPKADLSRVLLVGHSRGGEGVNRAAMDSLYPPPAAADGYRGPVRWKIRGTVLIGPTIFGQNPVADVPSVTLLPGCDGDVSDLQGEDFVDGTRGVSRGTALHSAVYVVGANHNYFNSEWTPGQAEAPAQDDFGTDPDQTDPVCTPGAPTRLTAAQQHKAGSTYIAAAARLFVAGDDRVRPLLDGSGKRAPSADPARVLTTPRRRRPPRRRLPARRRGQGDRCPAVLGDRPRSGCGLSGPGDPRLVPALRRVGDGEGDRPRRGGPEVVRTGRGRTRHPRQAALPARLPEARAAGLRSAEHDRYEVRRVRHRLRGPSGDAGPGRGGGPAGLREDRVLLGPGTAGPADGGDPGRARSPAREVP
ncbi:hypothetical protein RKD20_008498 [Streptomyces sp. SLBN-8D4]